MQGIELIQLDRSNASSQLLAKYYRLLDTSFEPALSSYVNIDVYAKKLVENAYVAVLIKDGEFVGTFSLYINDEKKEESYMSSLAVMDKYKGQGYSKYLMTEVVCVTKKAGFNTLKFEVKSAYTRAIKFYENFGFLRSTEKTKDDSTFYMYMPLKE